MSGWLFLGLTIIATVAGQLAYKQFFRSRRTGYVVAAIVLFCAAVVCTYFAVRALGIGRVYVGAALTYAITPLAARQLFGDRLTRNHFVALALIVAGVVVYNF